MIPIIGCSSAIREDQTFKNAIIRLSHRCVNANIRRNPGEYDVSNSFLPEQHVKISCVEGAFARLVDDRFPRDWGQFRNNLPALFSACENTPAWPLVADACAELATPPAFVFGEIRQIGAMSLARAHDENSAVSGSRQDASDRLNRRTRQR